MCALFDGDGQPCTDDAKLIRSLNESGVVSGVLFGESNGWACVAWVARARHPTVNRFQDLTVYPRPAYDERILSRRASSISACFKSHNFWLSET
jgi:hypothetical protein